MRTGRRADVWRLADAFRQMWLDNGISPEEIVGDHRAVVEAFVDERWGHGLSFHIAEDDGTLVGSACAQRFAGLYPALLVSAVRDFGYIWGVWVHPDHRRLGLGRRLTERCIEDLVALGCTHADLHAAPMGRGLYERLGFAPTNEMRLDLSGDATNRGSAQRSS